MNRQHAVNGVTLIIHQHDAECLRLPGSTIYLAASTTLGDLALAAGLKSFDYALPHDWVKAEFWAKGKDTPRGVWSYDCSRIYGEFVSVDQMLSLIALQMGIRQPAAA